MNNNKYVIVQIVRYNRNTLYSEFIALNAYTKKEES